MPHIKKILRETPLLRSLKLSGNRIKDNGLRQIGLGLKDNLSLELIDLSFNKIFGENNAGIFFTACADHPALRVINLRRNFIKDEGGKGVGRTLGNAQLEELDASFNLMEAASAQSMARGLGRHKQRAIKSIKLELQRFRQEHGAAILKPLANKKLDMPDFELLDFGFMLDIHTTFITAKEKALKVHPDLKIIHGLTYGLDHAKGPDLRQLVIRKADAVCTSFETTLVMLMEELAKEKKELTVAEFRKFIKQCNLYKDKSVTEAFEKVFEKPGTGFVDAVAILEAFDKEYPGKRFIPEPTEEEEMEEKPKEEKKKKGKGKGKGKGKDKGKGKEKDKKGGKGKKK
ncbi:unnamed protein product [Orchesella dallaii]|uniref:Uncharacterized protein n=1 Tax=Orchesella dallaii TaxID=48710 RepID=A0ABP1QC03_9HEXA